MCVAVLCVTSRLVVRVHLDDGGHPLPWKRKGPRVGCKPGIEIPPPMLTFLTQLLLSDGKH